MDMEEANAATAQGGLADVVARANAMASTNHHQPPPPPPSPPPPPPPHAPAAAHMSPRYPVGQIMIPYQEERRRPMGIACGGDAVTFEAAPPSMVDPFPSAAMEPRAAGYGLPQHQQQLAVQISRHAFCGRDVAMGAAAAADEGDDAMRTSPPAHYQMIKRKNEVRKVVCIPAPPATSGRAGGGGEVIPSDLWAWRKYGQKPIKGSPYPRGYYRCSSSKGCMARKQVERSRSDPNMLVITYTAEHDHPWPMQRNVLAGYARTHTHASAKKHQKDVATSSSNNGIHHSNSAHHPEQNAVGGDQPANMAAAAGDSAVGIGEGGVMYERCSGIQPDEVFAELEELEPADNAMILMQTSTPGGVSYEWHKF